MQKSSSILKEEIYGCIIDYLKFSDFFNQAQKEESYIDDIMVQVIIKIMKHFENKFDLRMKRESWFENNLNLNCLADLLHQCELS